MPEKNRAVELHDTKLQAIEQVDGATVLRLEVYLHVSDGRPAEDPGTGWTQEAKLTVVDGVVESAPESGAMWVLDGCIEVGETPFDNLVPMPFEHKGAVSVRFEGAEGLLLVKGRGVSLTLLGEPEFVEEVR
jgi:hypothetical protein